MIPEAQHVLDLFAHQAGTQGQPAGQALRRGNRVRMQAVALIGVHGPGAPVSGLDLIHQQQDVLCLQIGLQLPGEAGIQGHDAALALDAFNQHAGHLSLPAEGPQRLHVPRRDMGEAGGQGLEQLVIVVLSGGRQGGQRPTVKAVAESNDGGAVRPLMLRGPFPRHLDQAFIRLGAGIAEKHLRHPGFFAQGPGQQGAGLGIVQIGHMLNPVNLILDGGDPLRIRHAKGGHGDPRTHVNIFLSLHIPNQGSVS